MALTSFNANELYNFFVGNWTAATLLAAALSLLILYQWFLKGKKYNLPPAPTGVPIFGYLPFLGPEPYKDLHALSIKYGNVFSLYLGRTFVVILGDWVAMKEAFSKSSTTDRPPRLFDALPDGVGFSSVNGEEWIEQRRFSLKAMRDLGLGRGRWEDLVQEEVEDFVKLIAEKKGHPIDVKKLLTSSVSNNITSLIFGKRLPMKDPSRLLLDKSIDAVSQFFSQVGVRNYFPFLFDLIVKLGLTKYAKTYKQMVAFNQYVRQAVEKRKRSFSGTEPEVFIDSYLLEMENQQIQSSPSSFNEKNLYGNVQALFVGGSDTTRTSINWLLIAMASYPDIQENVQKEIDSVLGKEGKVQWSERAKLPYTFATIMEGQRWKTLAPLNTSRVATEDIQICGYDIPKGSTLIANNWAIHNDPRYWKNPDKFDPEHFLTDGGKQVILKPESYNAFSHGKRNCPGETIAMMEILCYFTTLLQKFTVQPPEGKKPKLEAILGLTYQAVPQELRFVPRE